MCAAAGASVPVCSEALVYVFLLWRDAQALTRYVPVKNTAYGDDDTLANFASDENSTYCYACQRPACFVHGYCGNAPRELVWQLGLQFLDQYAHQHGFHKCMMALARPKQFVEENKAVAHITYDRVLCVDTLRRVATYDRAMAWTPDKVALEFRNIVFRRHGQCELTNMLTCASALTLQENAAKSHNATAYDNVRMWGAYLHDTAFALQQANAMCHVVDMILVGTHKHFINFLEVDIVPWLTLAMDLFYRIALPRLNEDRSVSRGAVPLTLCNVLQVLVMSFVIAAQQLADTCRLYMYEWIVRSFGHIIHKRVFAPLQFDFLQRVDWRIGELLIFDNVYTDGSASGASF